MSVIQFQFPTEFRLLFLDLLMPHTHKCGILTGIHNVDIQTLPSVQTQHGQMKAIFLTCFNLNKASLLPACTLMHTHMHTHTYTNIFLSPLGKPLSFFSLHSVQITSRWDKSIMFPENLFPPTLLHSSGPMHFFLPPPTLVLSVQKDILISLEGGLGGQEGKQNLCNQQQDIHNHSKPIRAQCPFRQNHC